MMAVTLFCLAALGLTAAAGAKTSIAPGGGGGDGDPPLPPPKPNLVIGGAVTPFGGAEWELGYTVTNRGNAATSGFHVTVQQNGSILLEDTSQAGLAAGASRSESIHIPGNNGCYLPVRFFADPARAVRESNEDDNQRRVVGLLSPTSPIQPRYTVKAVSFHANDESGAHWLGSDEPYWIFSSVGMNGTSVTTGSHVFADIDTADAAAFGATEGCLYLSCSGGGGEHTMTVLVTRVL